MIMDYLYWSDPSILYSIADKGAIEYFQISAINTFIKKRCLNYS
jgi:hypothetical protein